jgi:hypothetical protein
MEMKYIYIVCVIHLYDFSSVPGGGLEQMGASGGSLYKGYKMLRACRKSGGVINIYNIRGVALCPAAN